MYETFFQKFEEKVPLSPTDKALLKQHLTHRKIRKRQFFLQEGEVCRQVAIVEKGAMRAFLIDNEGHEHIAAFALEGWTIADLNSFLRQSPGTLTIETLEDTDLTLISYDAYNALLETMPAFERFIRITITDAYVALQKRTTDMISLSAEERYKALVAAYPNILQRVPQHMIASFMGVTPETISRIRKRLHTS
ncbi:Crp/Fnr family transcriptional regulator [Chitinophaga sp. Cy-1792]|uniref:Crp/Fnr family transcriptional regulator n=1 Tax=Chitinophaga sp. Cy-1792 TaxID=2608339 RepID=UPI00141F2A01|nr:Crp/Fnr family transcriptional regulator [Chitinophaga sp. Cy-1792]NIG55084.1 Crp/Fnr family transcriptional regulator [Chitinophaga sp. Cy-1792]